jgi:hypothetical protein
MHNFKPHLVLSAIAALGLAVTMVLIEDATAQRRRAQRSEDFQRLVGGLGFGPALDLSRRPNEFDPRLADGSCEDEGRLSGPAMRGPQLSSSIFYYPPLKRSSQGWSGER